MGTSVSYRTTQKMEVNDTQENVFRLIASHAFCLFSMIHFVVSSMDIGSEYYISGVIFLFLEKFIVL